MKTDFSRSEFLTGLGGSAVARAVPDVDRHLRVYGLRPPTDMVYTAWATNHFLGYTVPMGGDVDRPIALDITDLRAMPQQTQIARLSCVKGWSAIAKWRGVQLRTILAMVRPMPHARFAVFQCFDRDSRGTPFYESLDLQEVRHSQTLLALDLDDRPIDPEHGGPVRLHAPTQLGYKNAKWIRRIDVVSSIEHIAGGKGGYWEDRGFV
jgi:DMSO/TMAO reductase YedYZ molybdopterin-dependent catalytic subunit